MKKIVLALASISLAVLPIVAMAQVGGTPPQVSTDLVALGNAIVNKVWIIFTIIAVICFVIAGILFMTAQGNPEKVQQARQAFLWGVVGVVAGILAYSIVTLVVNALR